MVEVFANSGDPDQMLCSVVSDLGLHYLPLTRLGVSSLQWINETTPDKRDVQKYMGRAKQKGVLEHAQNTQIQIQIPGPEVIKLCSCSTQLSMKISLLINMKMPTIVGIFIFISREIFVLNYI